MKNRLPFVLTAVFVLLQLVSGCQKPKDDIHQSGPRGADNMAYRWAKVVLKATANDTERFRPRPTVTSRMLALVFTSMYDAWSRFDSIAEPMYLSGVDRMADTSRTLKNKEIAISYAAYHALNHYFFSDSVMFDSMMAAVKLDPKLESKDASKPEGIGLMAANAVIQTRLTDGANEDGQMAGAGSPRYADYTGYKPINDPDHNQDLSRWQPKYFSDGKGGK